MKNLNNLHSKEVDLILAHSLSYLPRSDLKSCRLVNSKFKKASVAHYYSDLILVYPAKTQEFGDKNLIKRVNLEFSKLINHYSNYSKLVKFIELNIFCNKNLIQKIINLFPNLEGIKFTYVDFFEIDTRYIYSTFWHLDDLILVGCSDMTTDNCFYNLEELEFPMEIGVKNGED